MAYTEEHDSAGKPDAVAFEDAPIDEALVALVGELPPKERASVLLKDVLEYRLTEVAEIVDSTTGAVKAALHRGRAKLRAVRGVPPRRDLAPPQRRLLEAYAECFNRRDWDALRRLVQDDARLDMVGVTEVRMSAAAGGYFGKYAAMPDEWRFALTHVEGEQMLIHWRRVDGVWRPRTAVRLWRQDGKIVRIRDYGHVEYLLRNAAVAPLAEDR